ncbi:MAG: PEGA domain-containing protein [Paludibacteraceae bacterium]|nr:PEGA domain-containing protein [Paludibacteraceae bacterium]
MRRILISLVIWMTGAWLGMACAQELTVRSFDEDVKDLSAATQLRKDLNDVPCALVKVQLTAKGAEFSGNVMGDVQSKTSEYWVYMAQGSKRLTISAPGYLPLEVTFADYGVKSLQQKITYKLVINIPQIGTQKAQRTTQFVQFRVSPKGVNASVRVDGESVVHYVDQEGQYGPALSFGRHKYVVSAPGYYEYNGDVYVNDPQNTQIEEVALVASCGYLRLVAPREYNGAMILVNGEEKGLLPLRQDIRLPKGSYQLMISKANYAPLTQAVQIDDREQVTTLNVALDAQFLNMTFSAPENAEILLDGTRIGSGSATAQVSFGTHLVVARKTAHHDSEQEIVVAKGSATDIVLQAPEPKNGTVSVSSTPGGAAIYVDGTNTGKTTPAFIDLLEGNHKIMVRLPMYTDVTQAVSIRENEQKPLELTFGPKKTTYTVSFDSDVKGATLYVNGKKMGTMPIQVELPNRGHEIRVYAYGYKEYKGYYSPDGTNLEQNVHLKKKVEIDPLSYSWDALDDFYTTQGKIHMDFFGVGGNIGTGLGIELQALNTRLYMFEILPLTWGMSWNFLNNNVFGGPAKPNTLYTSTTYSGGYTMYNYWTPGSGTNLYYAPQLRFHIPCKDNLSFYLAGGPLISWTKYNWTSNSSTNYTDITNYATAEKINSESEVPESKYTANPIWFTAEIGLNLNIGEVENMPFYLRYQNGIVFGMAFTFGKELY